MNASAPEYEDLTFSLLGDSFTLRCRKEQKEELQQAVLNVQASTARILRDSPNISPQQAAILAAIDSQSRLQRYMGGSTPFQAEATKLVKEIEQVIAKARSQISESSH